MTCRSSIPRRPQNFWHFGALPATVCGMQTIVMNPSVDREDTRRVHRERERLIKERIQHLNRIKGLLATQGIYDYEPLRRHRRDRFEALGTAMGTPIPKHLRNELMRHLQRLELVLPEFAIEEKYRNSAAEVDPEPVSGRREGPLAGGCNAAWIHPRLGSDGAAANSRPRQAEPPKTEIAVMRGRAAEASKWEIRASTEGRPGGGHDG